MGSPHRTTFSTPYLTTEESENRLYLFWLNLVAQFAFFIATVDPGISSWPSMDGPSIQALSPPHTLHSTRSSRLPSCGTANSRKGRSTKKTAMNPPKPLPVNRGRKKPPAASFATSNVQAKSNNLSSSKSTVLLVKNCSSGNRGRLVTMRLSGGSGLYNGKPKGKLHSMAKAFKAPFYDAPVDTVDLLVDDNHSQDRLLVGTAPVYVGSNSSSAICTPPEHRKGPLLAPPSQIKKTVEV